MTKFSTNLGGPAPAGNEPGVGGVAPGGMPERWREKFYDYASQQSTTDWTQPEYAGPKPAPPTKFGRRVEQRVDVPQLPEANIRVRSKPPAVYYDMDGKPIPDNWTVVPISPGVLEAVKAGDLERDMSYKGNEPKPQPPQPQRRRHTTQAAPTTG